MRLKLISELRLGESCRIRKRYFYVTFGSPGEGAFGYCAGRRLSSSFVHDWCRSLLGLCMQPPYIYFPDVSLQDRKQECDLGGQITTTPVTAPRSCARDCQTNSCLLACVLSFFSLPSPTLSPSSSPVKFFGPPQPQ